MRNIALTYDDIALIPQYSEIESRHGVDTSIEIFAGGNKTIKLRVPFIGAPMDTVCGPEMCIKLYQLGAIGVLHRYNTIEEHCKMLNKCHAAGAECFVAIGATGDYLKRASALYDLGCTLFCIDVAHGNHKFVKQAVEVLRAEFGQEIHIMAGNVCEYEGAANLIKWGADSIRLGVGPGSVCSTRIVTGHGVPSITAIEDAMDAKHFLKSNVLLIADGGIRTSGDAAKALAVGADLVMCGSLLAGTEDSPPVCALRNAGILSDIHEVEFRGMASASAQADNGRVSIIEGIATTIPYKGLTETVITQMKQGIQSALSYTGVDNLKSFKEKARYTQVTNAGQIESRPHIK